MDAKQIIEENQKLITEIDTQLRDSGYYIYRGDNEKEQAEGKELKLNRRKALALRRSLLREVEKAQGLPWYMQTHYSFFARLAARLIRAIKRMSLRFTGTDERYAVIREGVEKDYKEAVKELAKDKELSPDQKVTIEIDNKSNTQDKDKDKEKAPKLKVKEEKDNNVKTESEIPTPKSPEKDNITPLEKDGLESYLKRQKEKYASSAKGRENPEGFNEKSVVYKYIEKNPEAVKDFTAEQTKSYLLGAVMHNTEAFSYITKDMLENSVTDKFLHNYLSYSIKEKENDLMSDKVIYLKDNAPEVYTKLIKEIAYDLYSGQFHMMPKSVSLLQNEPQILSDISQAFFEKAKDKLNDFIQKQGDATIEDALEKVAGQAEWKYSKNLEKVDAETLEASKELGNTNNELLNAVITELDGHLQTYEKETEPAHEGEETIVPDGEGDWDYKETVKELDGNPVELIKENPALIYEYNPSDITPEMLGEAMLKDPYAASMMPDTFDMKEMDEIAEMYIELGKKDPDLIKDFVLASDSLSQNNLCYSYVYTELESNIGDILDDIIDSYYTFDDILENAKKDVREHSEEEKQDKGKEVDYDDYIL